MNTTGSSTFRVLCDPWGEAHRQSLGILYAPLITADALRLYLFLRAAGDRSASPMPQEMILDVFGWDIQQLDEARIALEKKNLMRTYAKTAANARGTQTSLVFHILNPRTPEEFFQDPVYARILSGSVDSASLVRIRSLFPKAPGTEGYADVTEPFDSSFLRDWDKKKEEKYLKSAGGDLVTSYEGESGFDYAKFFRGLTALEVPNEVRTDDNLEYIGKTAVTFGISEERMQTLVGASVNMRDDSGKPSLDREKLFRRCEKENSAYRYEEGSTPYDLSPAEFLRRKQNGVSRLSDLDARLLYDLVWEWKLPVPVANVLVEYCLEANHGQLRRKSVEKIASEWVRSDVRTAQDALRRIAASIRGKEAPKKAGAKKKASDGSAEDKEELLRQLKEGSGHGGDIQ